MSYSDSSSDAIKNESSKTTEEEDVAQFDLPSFDHVVDHQIPIEEEDLGDDHLEKEEAEEELLDDEDEDDDADTESVPDDYTLDSSKLVHVNPVMLTETNVTHNTVRSTDSNNKIVTKLRKTFTLPGRRRLSTMMGRNPKRANTVNIAVAAAAAAAPPTIGTDNDVEKNLGAHLRLGEEEIAKSLVNLHTNGSNEEKGSPGTTMDDHAYFSKEEYDDEWNDVNDRMSEIPRNVQTGILSSLLKLYDGGTGNEKFEDTDESDESEEDNIVAASFQDLMTSKSLNELDQMRSRFNRKFKSDKKRSKSPNPRNLLLQHNNKTKSSVELPKFYKKRETNKTRLQKLTHHKKLARARITVHIADMLNRQRFILKLCKTFMLYGAPTHRLEEYLYSTSKVLEIDANFIYFPGCMLISFGDASTRTSEMHLVRCSQGLDLSRLYDVHNIYKKVIHDVVSVDALNEELDKILASKPLYNNYLLILANGLASLFITSWGFKGGWRDMPISFLLGSLVGFLQIVVSPKSNTYSSVFEVSASIVVAFISRAFGSIGSKRVFCFSAIAQSSLVGILPGYTILCGSLELQSRNMVSGAVRMFYAIIYSLFLGFGIILGSALYKWVDSDATAEITCPASIGISNYYRILFVPLFALTQLIIGQARFSQLPVMLIISCASYVGYYYASLHFASSAEFSLAIGSFLVGIMGNLYSRLGQGLAVSAMYPGILLLVPGSIGLKSSLTSGVLIADNIVLGKNTTSSSYDSSLSFGIAMIEVAIGLCVGLIGAALVVYPLGKKRTGLFTL